MFRILQQSLLLCLLLTWAAARDPPSFTLSVDGPTVVIGGQLTVHWTIDDDRHGVGIFRVFLVTSPPDPATGQVVTPNDQKRGDVVLVVSPDLQPGTYEIVAEELGGFAAELDHISVQLVPSDTTDTSTSDTISLTETASTTSTSDVSNFPSSVSQSSSPSTTPVGTPAAVGQASSLPSSSTDASGATQLTSKTPVIVGSILGALILLALLVLAVLVILRRRKTRKETVQFYEHKMVRPASPPTSTGMDSPLSWEPLTLHNNAVGLNRHDTDVKQSFDPEPLPAYGYSNYDFIEKADYHDTNARSSLPYGAMPAPMSSRIPKIVMTPATPPESESSVLNGSSMSFGSAGSVLHHDSTPPLSSSPLTRAYGGIE